MPRTQEYFKTAQKEIWNHPYHLTDAATFNSPRHLAMGPGDKLYIADRFLHKVRMLDLSTRKVTTAAGSVKGYLDGKTRDAKGASAEAADDVKEW